MSRIEPKLTPPPRAARAAQEPEPVETSPDLDGAIVVLNPNATDSCTVAIERALEPYRVLGGAPIVCVTNAKGPPTIACQAHVDDVIVDLREIARGWGNRAGAFVVACFSDPGLAVLREEASQPVFGIAESGILTALSLGERFGVVALGPASLPRHRRYVRQLGVGDRYVGSRPAHVSVPDLADFEATQDKMQAAARRLVEEDGADVLVLGCAGMPEHRAPLAEALGVPVVEPCQAAVGHAIAALARGW